MIFNFVTNKNSLELYLDNIKTGYIKYSINDYVIIEELEVEDIYLNILLDKFIAITYYHGLSYIANIDLTKYHFKLVDGLYYLDIDSINVKRLVKIGDGITGEKNNICDVDGVRVSHFTVNDNGYNTGLTIISPHQGNIFKEKVVGSCYSFNGFGKSIGLVQVNELGTIETNIVLTSTMNAPKIADAVIENALIENSEIAIKTGTVNPVVMECNDGDLNNSRDRILGRLSYKKALKDLSQRFKQGGVGAGSGMTCHGFKGGIGTSSRKIEINGKEYTIGILVNSNFGESNGKALVFKGRYLGEEIKNYEETFDEKGSIIACFATDAPLSERQIKRVLKRIEIGIGRTGSYAGNGSGDVFIGFSTTNKVKHFNDNAVDTIYRLSDNNINAIFKRTCECVEEAILNSMLFSKGLKGYLKEVKSLNEYNKLFIDLIDEEIEYEV